MYLKPELMLDKELLKKFKEAPPCEKPHLENGKNYRLVPKPNCKNAEKLTRHGHEIEYAETTVGGVATGKPTLCVKVPLGKHGNDNFAFDTKTEKVVCLHCVGAKEAKETK